MGGGNANKNSKTANLAARPPVVVVMGHVDHGKTSLLDYIRHTDVIAQESGGITQHVGAYEAEHKGKKITFLDTPGHEAFSAMRSRGAGVADIAVLVVAADEGVKEQTKEAIVHAKRANAAIIVAFNKMDKPGAIPAKVAQELIKQDVVVESLGGKVPAVELSAKTGKGVNELLDLILLVAEMEELKGDINKPAEGVVVEAYLDSKRGPTATLLVLDGALKAGDIMATPSTAGKAKILQDFQYRNISIALPSAPVVVVGFENAPQVGEVFKSFPDMDSALGYLEKKARKAVPEGEAAAVVDSGKKTFNIILKADVQGSLGAIQEVLKGLPQDNIVLRVISGGVGEITENDVQLAGSAKAMIIGFRIKSGKHAVDVAERAGVRVVIFEVIYELIQGVRKFMERSREPQIIRRDVGKLKVLVVFIQDQNRQIVGGRIIAGELQKGLRLEVRRGEDFIGKGKIVNLQKDKKDIGKGKVGEEVGILYEGEGRIAEGDILTAFVQEQQRFGEI